MIYLSDPEPFYCMLCESKHSRLEPRARCPQCGREFCHKSLEESLSTGIKKCPFCPELLQNFSHLSQRLKEQLSDRVEFVPEKDDTTKKDVIDANLIDENTAFDDIILETEGQIAKVAETVSTKTWKTRKKKYGRSGHKRKTKHQKNDTILGLPTKVFFTMGLVITLILVYPVLRNVYELNPEIADPSGRSQSMKFSLEVRDASSLEAVTDGEVIIAFANDPKIIIEYLIVSAGKISTVLYYDNGIELFIAYQNGSWEDYNCTMTIPHIENLYLQRRSNESILLFMF